MFSFLKVLGPEIFKSFESTIFWSGNIQFLTVFIGILCLSALPIIKLLNPLKVTHRSLIIPIAGFINLLFILLIWQNWIYLTGWTPSALLPFSGVAYGLEWVVLKWLQTKKLITLYPVTLKPSNFWLTSLSILYISLFFFISARHFDSTEQTFFVPGYELNHDAIAIASSIKMMQENISQDHNLASYLGGQLLHNQYPSGGIQLELFFASLLKLDSIYLFSRVIVASYLLLLFVITSWWLKLSTLNLHHQRWFFMLILVFMVINYLTISFLDTAIPASTLVIPLIVTLMAIAHLYFLRQISPRIFLLTFIWVALITMFTYLYIPLLMVWLFILGLRLTMKGPPHWFRYTLLTSVAALANPHNWLTSLNWTRQMTSLDQGNHLLINMHGNVSHYISPFMAMSLWFSHPIYLTPEISLSNHWLVAVALLSLLAIAAFSHRKPATHIRLCLSVALSLPIFCFLGLSFLTQSPYQNAKVMQVAATLWPLGIFLFSFVYLDHQLPKISRNITQVVLVTVVILGILSGLFAMVYVGKPVLAVGKQLQVLAANICADSNLPVQVISRDEWAKYFLIHCNRLDLYFDRNLDWNRIDNFNKANHLIFISQPCVENQYVLPASPATGSALVLVDRCINYQPPDSQVISANTPIRVYAPSQLKIPN